MSLINKTLNELDKRQGGPNGQSGVQNNDDKTSSGESLTELSPQVEQVQETKPEVAFLESKTKNKSQRSKTWWLRVVSSTATIVLAVVVGVLYYQQMNHSLDVVDMAIKPKSTPTPDKPIEQQASAKQTEQPDNPVQTAQESQPQSSELALKQDDNQSDVPVSQPKLVVLKPVTADGEQVERQSTLRVITEQAAEQQSANNQAPESQQSEPEQSAQVEPPVSSQQSEAIVTKANLAKPQGAPEASTEQMSISKVEMTPQQRAQKLFLQGKKFAQDGMIQPAIDSFLQALQFNSIHQQSRVELAGLYYGRNMQAEALEVLSDGLNLEPSNRAWSLIAAKIHFRRDNFAAALAYLQLPVHAREDVEYVALKAGVLQKLKRYAQAADTFAQLASSYPDNGRWWLGLATALEGKQDYVGAIEAYRRSLRLSNISQRSKQFILQRLQLLEN